jgi:hypothetical protein
MQPNECFAYFAISGSAVVPEEVSGALALAPSKAWRAGDPHDAHRVPGKKRAEGFWRLDSRLARDGAASFEDHVKDVLEQLAAVISTAATLSKTHTGVIGLVGYFHESYPGLNFGASTIRRISELGAELDCDFYYLARLEETANQSLQPTAPSRRG